MSFVEHGVNGVAILLWAADAAHPERLATPFFHAAAAAAMDALAARQPGYRGTEDARGADGEGVTVSYWADEASALAWRDHPDHAAVRAQGRTRWYSRYTVTIARVERGYAWEAA